MPFRPLSDRLVVRPVKTDRIGHILIPGTAKLEQKRGVVLAVGPGRWCPTSERRIPVQVRAGDLIEYGWDGHKVRDESGEELMVVHEAEVLCVIANQDDGDMPITEEWLQEMDWEWRDDWKLWSGGFWTADHGFFLSLGLSRSKEVPAEWTFQYENDFHWPRGLLTRADLQHLLLALDVPAIKPVTPGNPDVTIDPETCPHKSIYSSLSMAHIEDMNRWQAAIKITCADCGTPFRFIGLPAGLDLDGASVSIDGQEGRFAVAPKGQVVTPLESTECAGFTVRKVQ